MEKKMEGNKAGEIAIKKIIEFAQNSTSDVWHQMIMDWNWDNFTGFFDWLIENHDTDKATILMIYWKSGPSKYFKNKDIIENRYINAFYKKSEIAFDPKNDGGDDWTKYIITTDTIPEIMFNKLDGRNIPYPENFIEGIPEKLFYEIEELYE
jgi:hypothetical protein